MMEIVVVKMPNGVLAPATDEDVEKIRKIKAGAGVRLTATKIRNYEHHKKYFALVSYAFEIWSELHGDVVYKGERIAPNFDRFRKDLTIMTGHYERTFNVRGEMRLDARSISFANMAQDEFEKLYSKTIDVILSKILAGHGLTEEKLRNYVDNVMSFD